MAGNSPRTGWDCASPSLMAEGNPQPGFHSPLISPFYPQYITITPPFLLVKFDGNLAKNGDLLDLLYVSTFTASPFKVTSGKLT